MKEKKLTNPSIHLKKELISACEDLAHFINKNINEKDDIIKIKLSLNSKINTIHHLVDRCTDIITTMEEKMYTLNEALQILNPLPNKLISINDKLLLAWLDLLSLISSIKLTIAILALDPRTLCHQKIMAILLSDLLTNIVYPNNFPEIPPVDSPDHRKILVTILNILQDYTTIFDVLLEIVPFINKNDLNNWIRLDLQYYYSISLIMRKYFNKDLYQIYKKTKEEEVFAKNYIILHLNLISLAYLFRTIYQLYGEEWKEYLELPEFKKKQLPINFDTIMEFIIKITNKAINNLIKWKKNNHILVTEKHFEYSQYKELINGYHAIKALKLKNEVFKKLLLNNKPLNNDEKDYFHLKFTELSLIWEILMQKTIQGKNLNEAFFKIEQSNDYIEYFSEFLETIVLESIISNTPAIYFEKLRPYQEVFIYLTPKIHPEFLFKRHLLELYLFTRTNFKINLKECLNNLRRITPHLFRRPKDHFSILNLQLTIITKNKGIFPEELFKSTFEKAKKVLDNEWVPKEYELKVKDLLSEIYNEYYYNSGSFRKFYDRLVINIHDFTTWAIPLFQNKDSSSYPLQYFPFNRKKDRIIEN